MTPVGKKLLDDPIVWKKLLDDPSMKKELLVLITIIIMSLMYLGMDY